MQSVEIRMSGADRCCFEGCGKKTSSHGLAVEARGVGSPAGPPTLVGAVCHTHWDGVEVGADALTVLSVLDVGLMHAAPLTVEQLAERQP